MADYDLSKLNDIFDNVEKMLIEHSSGIDEFNEYKEIEIKNFTDNDYYWIMVYVIFYSGFNAETVDKHKAGIEKYFSDYKTAMRYNDDEIENIKKYKNIIQNKRKIESCISNAKEFYKIVKRFGSFEKYINYFKPSENDENLFLFKEDLVERFKGIGNVTAYHFMMDIGLDVIKPDRVLMRIFRRLDLVRGEDDIYRGIEVGRAFAKATGLPIRYIDIMFVSYGQMTSAKKGNTKKWSICSEKNPQCDSCGIKKYCKYFVQQKKKQW